MKALSSLADVNHILQNYWDGKFPVNVEAILDRMDIPLTESEDESSQIALTEHTGAIKGQFWYSFQVIPGLPYDYKNYLLAAALGLIPYVLNRPRDSAQENEQDQILINTEWEANAKLFALNLIMPVCALEPEKQFEASHDPVVFQKLFFVADAVECNVAYRTHPDVIQLRRIQKLSSFPTFTVKQLESTYA